MGILAPVDWFLNRITMYRLVFYGLIGLLAIAAVFGYLGILPYSPLSIAYSVALITGVAYVTNVLFAKVFSAAPNVESVYITSFILALIITPVAPADFAHAPFLVWAAIWAMASKYMFALGRRHIFNPAAFAVALTALTISGNATWWIGGNLPLLPFVALVGFLILRKVQRFELVGVFAATAFVSTLFTSGGDIVSVCQTMLLRTPLIFFASVMLTEPLTLPAGRTRRLLYGAFVGILFAPAMHIGTLYSTPELALLAGNVFSYAINPTRRHLLRLLRIEKQGTGIYDFVFAPDVPLRFRPGQYMEWTLPHKGADGRGNRRYFTLASSPTEREVRLGVKFYEKPSSFKKTLLGMAPGDTMSVSHIAGDFVLPKDAARPLVFIAGGIGVTPFRSMLKRLVDRQEKRDIVMFYSNKTDDEIAYRDVFDDARRMLGIKTVYALTGAGAVTYGPYAGKVNPDLIAAEAPHWREATFYLSGPRSMVLSFQRTLALMGVPESRIKSDFFPGFA